MLTFYFSDSNEEVKVISPDGLEKMLQKKNTLIVDVRESDEFAEGHIPSAVSIPLGDLSDRINEIDASQDIYLICRSGARSDFGAKILIDKGYNHVTNVVPGMMAWEGNIEAD